MDAALPPSGRQGRALLPTDTSTENLGTGSAWRTAPSAEAPCSPCVPAPKRSALCGALQQGGHSAGPCGTARHQHTRPARSVPALREAARSMGLRSEQEFSGTGSACPSGMNQKGSEGCASPALLYQTLLSGAHRALTQKSKAAECPCCPRLLRGGGWEEHTLTQRQRGPLFCPCWRGTDWHRAPAVLGSPVRVSAVCGSIAFSKPPGSPSPGRQLCSVPVLRQEAQAEHQPGGTSKAGETTVAVFISIHLQVIQKSKCMEFLKSNVFVSEKAARNNKMGKRRSKYIHRKIIYLH